MLGKPPLVAASFLTLLGVEKRRSEQRQESLVANKTFATTLFLSLSLIVFGDCSLNAFALNKFTSKSAMFHVVKRHVLSRNCSLVYVDYLF